MSRRKNVLMVTTGILIGLLMAAPQPMRQRRLPSG